MSKRISLWDVDGVWYEGISTDYVAELSTVDPNEMLHHFLDSSMISQNDVDLWYSGGEGIETPADLSRMLYDLFHKMKQDGKPRIPRDIYLRGRQLLAKGMTMQQIRKVADAVPYNPGVREAAKTLRVQGVHQAAFTDGLGPFVHYKMIGMVDHLEAVPMLVETAGNRVYFNGEMSNKDDVVLTGETEHFDKAQAAYAYLQQNGYPLSDVAAIDDGGHNATTLLVPIMRAGGIAVAYNPNSGSREIFNRYSVPILKGTDLRAFAEIVLDPREITIARYCI